MERESKELRDIWGIRQKQLSYPNYITWHTQISSTMSNIYHPSDSRESKPLSQQSRSIRCYKSNFESLCMSEGYSIHIRLHNSMPNLVISAGYGSKIRTDHNPSITRNSAIFFTFIWAAYRCAACWYIHFVFDSFQMYRTVKTTEKPAASLGNMRIAALPFYLPYIFLFLFIHSPLHI